MAYKTLIGHQHYVFNDLKTLMAKQPRCAQVINLQVLRRKMPLNVLPHKWHWPMFH